MAKAKVDKVVVTNKRALTHKYGAAGAARVVTAVNKLIAADARRGLTTVLVDLADARRMSALDGKAVEDADNAAQNKRAIDAVYHALTPDYVLLLGSVDVIPHQPMRNPLFTGDLDDDPDRLAPGDLPYACEAKYNLDAAKFIGPTRVVGRLPNVTGDTSPAYLLALLKQATGWKSGTREAYSNYFAVTARAWRKSTELSLKNIFGGAANMRSSPSDTRPWTAAERKRLMHFFNCHGAQETPQFFGDPGFPVSLDQADIDAKISPGAVAAAECCYGGELYALSADAPHMAICNTYLISQAYGFMGSTTVAYGPAEGNGAADLICQYFMQNVLAGASLGRAFLEARQKFVRTESMTDTVNLKTLAQFNLYGDPSIQPVDVASPRVATASAAKALPAKSVADRAERAERRRQLISEGIALERNKPAPVPTETPPAAAAYLRKLAQSQGLAPGQTLSFGQAGTAGAGARLAKRMLGAASGPTDVHILFARPAREAKGVAAKAKGAAQQRIPHQIVLLVGKEANGEIVSVSEYHSR